MCASVFRYKIVYLYFCICVHKKQSSALDRHCIVQIPHNAPVTPKPIQSILVGQYTVQLKATMKTMAFAF